MNASALLALAVAAAPLLVHLLVQRRAERFPFPTLRFLRPTRLAAIRRHVLEDIPLLVVRAAILAAAVAALAGPIFITAPRRQAWDRRLVRAVVLAEGAGRLSSSARPNAPASYGGRDAEAIALHATRDFEGSAVLSDAIRRAVAWLESAPPARREIVIASPLPIGSITAADIASIPADVGVRFERRGALPASRTVPFGRILATSGEVEREVTLAGPQTSVRDEAAPSSAGAWPIDVVAQPDSRPAVDAAIAAVRAQRVWVPAPGRRALMILVSSSVPQPSRAAISDAAPVRVPWIADAIARLTRDTDLQTAAARVPHGTADVPIALPPWQLVAVAADGAPLVAAASAADRLLVASGAPASDLVTPLLMRSIANALAATGDVTNAEVVPIADGVLQSWTRPPAASPAPRVDNVDEDDRRWFWIAALLLLGFEAWMRRSRRRPADSGQETVRVA